MAEPRRSTRVSMPAATMTCDHFEVNMHTLFKKIGLSVVMDKLSQIQIPKTNEDYTAISKRGDYKKFGIGIAKLAYNHFKTNPTQPYHVQLGWKPADGGSPHSMALVIFQNGRIEFFDANGKMEPTKYISDRVMGSVLSAIGDNIPNGTVVLVNKKNINKGGKCIQWSIFYHYFRHLILEKGIINNNVPRKFFNNVNNNNIQQIYGLLNKRNITGLNKFISEKLNQS